MSLPQVAFNSQLKSGDGYGVRGGDPRKAPKIGVFCFGRGQLKKYLFFLILIKNLLAVVKVLTSQMKHRISLNTANTKAFEASSRHKKKEDRNILFL